MPSSCCTGLVSRCPERMELLMSEAIAEDLETWRLGDRGSGGVVEFILEADLGALLGWVLTEDAVGEFNAPGAGLHPDNSNRGALGLSV